MECSRIHNMSLASSGLNPISAVWFIHKIDFPLIITKILYHIDFVHLSEDIALLDITEFNIVLTHDPSNIETTW